MIFAVDAHAPRFVKEPHYEMRGIIICGMSENVEKYIRQFHEIEHKVLGVYKVSFSLLGTTAVVMRTEM